MKASVLCLSALVLSVPAYSQKLFRNLDFETAGLIIPPTGIGQYGGAIDPTLAFVDWTVGSAQGAFPTYFLYNNGTVGSPAVNLIGPAFPNGVGLNPLQGSYSVFMEYFFDSGLGPSLSQTGLIPADAKSISFLVDPLANNVILSLNGVNIPLLSSDGGTLLSGDVSAFAGQSAEVTFRTQRQLYFDDIRFSTTSVPEPCTPALIGLGAAVVFFCRGLSNELPLRCWIKKV